MTIVVKSLGHASFQIEAEGKIIYVDLKKYGEVIKPTEQADFILVTHGHADHFLGIMGLLKTLKLMNYKKTLYIYGPKGVKNQLKKFMGVFGFRPNYVIKVQEVNKKFFDRKCRNI